MNATNPLETKFMPPEELESNLEDQINQSLYDLEHTLLPQLGHSQAKRLLMAIAAYPMKTEDFSKETEAMIKAYSALKSVTDALVALGVEVSLQGMLEAQAEMVKAKTQEVKEEIKTKKKGKKKDE